MSRRIRLAAGLLAASLITSGSAGAATPDCLALDEELRAAVKAGAKDEFPALQGRMLREPTCDGEFREHAGRALARAHLHAVRKEIGEDKPVPRAELDVARRYGQPWQVMSALGDDNYEAGRWSEAVEAYEIAIDDLRDEAANPKAPDRAVEERIVKRAYQARALAPGYVKTRRFRGKPSGLASPKFRSFTAEVVPVPIRFPYNESVLTPEGEQAARDILDYLSHEKPGSVQLIGHTDPRGSDAHNKRLSEARAEAVGNYLKQHGYQGAVSVDGRGESQPFQPDDSSKYTEEERYAFDRRVEYRLEPH